MRAVSITSLVLILSLFVVAACGGDDALSKDEYVKQANKICRDSNAEIEKIGDPQSAEELPEYIEKAKNVTSKSIDEMDALKPPEDLEKDHDAFVKEGRQVLDLADQLAKAAESKDEAELQKLSEEGDKLDETSDKRAERMGLTDCASDS